MDEHPLRQHARDVAYERVQMWRSHQLQQDLMPELMKIVERGEDEANKWWRSQDGIAWQTRRNALLESILLHYRNLLEFLAPSLGRTSEQTVTARMFRDVPAPIHHRKEINNRLSHIAKKRADLTQEQKYWDGLHKMLDELEEAWQGFIRALNANYPERVAWFTIFDPILAGGDAKDEEE